MIYLHLNGCSFSYEGLNLKTRLKETSNWPIERVGGGGGAHFKLYNDVYLKIK